MNAPHAPSRRRFLHHGARIVAAGTLPALGLPARASPTAERRLALLHTHTAERIELAYAVGEHYLPDALGALNHFLRDHYSGEVGAIDPALLDQLHRVQRALGFRHAAEVVSGFRGAATNARLRRSRGGGVARHSLHLEGRALDIRLPGVPIAELRDAALAMQSGGVGFYPRERFVHLDTGAVRQW